MFNDDFYPTPLMLAHKLIYPIKGRLSTDTYVLEPSGGKGDLLDMLRGDKPSYFRNKEEEAEWFGNCRLYTCEINADLRAILAEKGYPIVADDFLGYKPQLHYDYIVMNPPFSTAPDHLKHAWDILGPGGEIHCIYPATGLEDDNVKKRFVLTLLADQKAEIEKVGSAFKQAERRTNVEVVIIRLKKPALEETMGWRYSNDLDLPEFTDKTENQEVIPVQDYARELVTYYQAAVGAYEAYNLARQKIVVYQHPFCDTKHSWKDDPLKKADEKNTPKKRWNTFYDLLTEQAWALIFDHPGFQSLLTVKARQMMQIFRQRQKRMDFTLNNIKAMFDELASKRGDLLKQVVLDAFESLTEYHKDNRIDFETNGEVKHVGWKTNRAWRVNHICVLPHFVEFDWKTFKVKYEWRDKLNDIDRAMCVIGAYPFNDIVTIEQALEKAFKANPYEPGTCESEFFLVRYFKKGTIHITFKDRELLARFNYKAAQAKNWLPPEDTYGKADK